MTQHHTRDAGTYLASIPAMLTTTPPPDSLILILTDHSGIPQLTVRHGLREFIRQDPGTLAAKLRLANADRALIAVVAEPEPNRASDQADQHEILLTLLASELRRVNIKISQAWTLPKFEAGARWRSLMNGNHGVLPDPASTVLAASNAAKGRVVNYDRDEIKTRFTPDPVRCNAVNAAIEQAAHALTAPDLSEPREFLARLVADYDDTTGLPPTDAAELAARLRNPAIADVFFQDAAARADRTREPVWLDAARCLTGRPRAVAATLYSFSAYISGDAITASVAITVAQIEDPGYAFARMVAAALHGGFPPQQVRQFFANRT
ncbi:DUF4192 domain-containing protein [Nocardia tengchongensis]|uniref:DUF4192 domain-containing protein n=1 Tax=Nocardia tengchongensis TaxID=2055889 RepID=UPI003696B13F